MGKSILSRTVYERFVAAHPEDVLGLDVDARGVGFRSFLNQLAQQLVERAEPRFEEDRQVLRFLDELRIFANNSQINKSQLDAVAEKHGVFAEAGADALVARLRSRFTWERTRSKSTGVVQVQVVGDELLHAAVEHTLSLLADKGLTTLIFFDDLDQASTVGEQNAAQALMQVIALKPALGLVHMRSEAMFADVRRELDYEVVVAGMEPELLWRVLQKRLEPVQSETVRVLVGGAEGALRRLAHGTDNPYVFLRWVSGLLRALRLPLPGDWTGRLGEVLQARALPKELLLKVTRVVDTCAVSDTCSEQDLLRGGSALAQDPLERLSEEELELPRRYDILLPVNRFDASTRLRLDPVLDLLRPSVVQRIQGA